MRRSRDCGLLPDLPKGFRPVSGKRSPPKGDTKYEVIFRNGLIDDRGYTASQLNWIHTGWAFDVVAVREIK